MKFWANYKRCPNSVFITSKRWLIEHIILVRNRHSCDSLINARHRDFTLLINFCTSLLSKYWTALFHSRRNPVMSSTLLPVFLKDFLTSAQNSSMGLSFGQFGGLTSFGTKLIPFDFIHFRFAFAFDAKSGQNTTSWSCSLMRGRILFWRHYLR